MQTKTLEERLGKIPIFRTLGFRIEAVSEGSAILIGRYDPRYHGIFQSFHGGLLTTLTHTAACIALLASAGAEAEITSRSDCTAKATIIKFGKKHFVQSR